MNQNLIEINDNYGVVTDEHNNIKLIKKENNSYPFEEILLRENELEELKLKLKEYTKSLFFNRQCIVASKIASAIFLTAFVIGFAFLYSQMPIGELVFCAILSCLCYKGITAFAFGTKSERDNEKKELTSIINQIESQIPVLEKELEEIKEKTTYKDNYPVTSEYKEEIDDNSLTENSHIQRKNKMRVLRLSEKG